MTRLYLDHAASTPLGPEAKKAMLPWLGQKHGNPSSLHADGRRARQAIDLAREQVSEALGCLFGEVIFTSGGTESATLALMGSAMAAPVGRRRIVMGQADHHCVLHAEPLLARLGFRVDLARVDETGRLDLDHLASLLGPDVALVSLLHGNNETGALSPAAQAAALARDAGAWVHVDAVQTFPGVRVEDLGADMVSGSSHKFTGPAGAGFLFLRSGVKIQPLFPGGGQEREMRGGTENGASLAGMGAAARAGLQAGNWQPEKRAARDAFVARLNELAPEGLAWTLPRHDGLPGHAHLRLAGIPAETMLIRLDRLGVSASAGAACSSGSLEPSHVLLACGLAEQEAREGLRFTFGRGQTPADGARGAEAVAEAASEIRKRRGRGA